MGTARDNPLLRTESKTEPEYEEITSCNAKLDPYHLYRDVYYYNSHEIWLCRNIKEENYGNDWFYYIDGNTLINRMLLRSYCPKFKTAEDAILHGEKRIDNITLEMKLVQALK
ncbi:MAG: hypothetical protein ACUZ8E_18060 [Candidatus Anammoxibacter sp.]